MGKSSPTKLQLKHIPDLVVLETIYFIQNQWVLHRVNSVLMDAQDGNLIRLPLGRLSYERKRLAHLDDIHEVLKPLPKKLLWRKLQHLEDRRLIASYGPSCTHFKVL